MEVLRMELPIVVDNMGDVTAFRTLEEAADYIEPIDVTDNQYSGYDSKGRLLAIRVAQGKVVFADGETAPTHAEQLTAALRRHLAACSVATNWIEQASLQELISKRLECGV